LEIPPDAMMPIGLYWWQVYFHCECPVIILGKLWFKWPPTVLYNIQFGSYHLTDLINNGQI